MKSGDKVVCVDDSFPSRAFYLFTSMPVKNKVYIIRDFDASWTEPNIYLIWLIGISGTTHPRTGREEAFKAARFRLLDELKEESRNKHEKSQSDTCPLCGAAHVDAGFREKESPL